MPPKPIKQQVCLAILIVISLIGWSLSIKTCVAETVADHTKTKQRFYMGVYYPAIRHLQTRADFQVAINFWLDEYADLLNLESAEAFMFESIESLKYAFEVGELDFIMAPPILLAKNIERSHLADGFVGTSVDGNSEYGTVLLVRKDQNITDLKQLVGKKLVLSENDDLAAMFLDTLMIKTFRKHYHQVFSRVSNKEKQSAVVMDLFFNQADIGMTYREVYHLMSEMNPQIGNSLKVLASFAFKSPNYGYFHREYPVELRAKITQMVSELNNQPRSQQILEELRMSSIIPCAVDELLAFDMLIKEYELLQKGIKK